jgi:hypothetical protein
MGAADAGLHERGRDGEQGDDRTGGQRSEPGAMTEHGQEPDAGGECAGGPGQCGGRAEERWRGQPARYLRHAGFQSYWAVSVTSWRLPHAARSLRGSDLRRLGSPDAVHGVPVAVGWYIA